MTPRNRKSANGAASPTTPELNTETLTGTVESIVFRSEESGYTVCAIRLPEQRDTMTVVGTCAAVWIGETVKAEGRWVQHKQHGRQFQADTLSCVVPTSARGIERYLASGMVRGIGKVMAKRLVDHFGPDTLQVIEKESKRLQEVTGIGRTLRERIKESWIEQKAVRDIMIFLQGHGVGTAAAARIYRQYGAQAIGLITENPYRLCDDIWGIGFKTADGVAMSIGIPPHSEARARAGIVHTLGTMTDEGHCFCPKAQLVLDAQALLDIPPEILTTALDHALKEGSLVDDEDHIYLRPLHEAEIQVADKLARLRRTPPTFRPIVIEKAMPWVEAQIDITLDPRQAEALRMALTEKVSIITGGPGVGKTTIIRALVDIFEKRSLRVALAAPTGRAAKRMEEATGHAASTIHRLLKFMPRTGTFDHNADMPLQADVVILDEVSMIDVLLMRHFLVALCDETCLVMVGDTDQLPSVGPGNVLRDMINSAVIPSVKLDHIFRQAHGGLIVQNAHHINAGEYLDMPTDDDSDFFFIEANDPEQAISRVINLVTRRIPRRFGLDPMSQIQVLTPMRKNQLGADNLNTVLQEALNPHGLSVQRFGRHYRQNDRVMQIRNNYDKDVFNGDIGLVADIDAENQIVTVNFDGRFIAFEFAELDELVHAYACTIHKSQGSEYPAVVLLITTQHYRLLQRNLLYTAVTRGRRLVCLVGSARAIGMAIRNNEMQLRRTGLLQRLIGREREPATESH